MKLIISFTFNSMNHLQNHFHYQKVAKRWFFGCFVVVPYFIYLHKYADSERRSAEFDFEDNCEDEEFLGSQDSSDSN